MTSVGASRGSNNGYDTGVDILWQDVATKYIVCLAYNGVNLLVCLVQLSTYNTTSLSNGIKHYSSCNIYIHQNIDISQAY